MPARSVKILGLRNIATHPKHLPSSPWQTRLRFGHPETPSLVAIKASIQLISSQRDEHINHHVVMREQQNKS